MPLLILIVIMVLLGIVFPTVSKHLIFAPILGTAAGGFAWSVACICCSLPISLTTFCGFILVGILLAEVLVTFDT